MEVSGVKAMYMGMNMSLEGIHGHIGGCVPNVCSLLGEQTIAIGGFAGENMIK